MVLGDGGGGVPAAAALRDREGALWRLGMEAVRMTRRRSERARGGARGGKEANVALGEGGEEVDMAALREGARGGAQGGGEVDAAALREGESVAALGEGGRDRGGGRVERGGGGAGLGQRDGVVSSPPRLGFAPRRALDYIGWCSLAAVQEANRH